MVEFNKLKIKENCVERCHLCTNFVEAYAYSCDSPCTSNINFNYKYSFIETSDHTCKTLHAFSVITATVIIEYCLNNFQLFA